MKTLLALGLLTMTFGFALAEDACTPTTKKLKQWGTEKRDNMMGGCLVGMKTEMINVERNVKYCSCLTNCVIHNFEPENMKVEFPKKQQNLMIECLKINNLLE